MLYFLLFVTNKHPIPSPMKTCTFSLIWLLLVSTSVTFAQDLIITQKDAARVYHLDDPDLSPAVSARTSTIQASPHIDPIAYAPEQLSKNLPVTPEFDFFQGLQSPYDPSVWVYLEREQIGAGYRLVLFNRESGESSTLRETDNVQRQELAFKPIAWTDQPDELYVEGLFFDSAEEHEGLWVLSTSTGQLRRIALPFAYVRTPLLSPDRQKLILTGTLDDIVDLLHGNTDVVYEFNLVNQTHRTIARQPGVPMVVEGWNLPAARNASAQEAQFSSLDYYLPWDAGTDLCVSRHGTPDPVGEHNYVGRCNLFGPGGHHGYAAIDFATSLSSDDNVRAAAAGVVTFSGISGSLSTGYGRLVIIRHSDGTRTYYAHNETLLVSEGQSVARGQVIALEGTTGGSTGDHIHFEWRAAGGNVSTPGSFTGIGEPRQDYSYRSNNTTEPLDTQAPTTAISAGSVQSGDFTVNFSDQDNVGVTRRFYQVLERNGDHWYANRGNGFFNDNYKELYSEYVASSGSWSINDEHLRQSDAVSTNTGLTISLSQTSLQPYLYEFSARVISTTGPRKFGLHLMADGPTLSQRGNSYLVWFNGEQNQIIVYKTIDDVLYTQQVATVALDDQWASYKITYSPAYGVLEVFRNDRSLVTWTDPDPIKTGNSLSLRTNATVVEFDDLKVYKYRAGSSVNVTAGSASTKDLRTAEGKIKSKVRDAAGNWSAPGNLDVTLTSAARLASSATHDMIVYPNPIDGNTAVMLRYQATSEQPVQWQIIDVTGRVLETHYDTPRAEEVRKIDIQEVFQTRKAGYYFVQLRQGDQVQTTRVVRK